jgi:hypothetical protein
MLCCSVEATSLDLLGAVSSLQTLFKCCRSIMPTQLELLLHHVALRAILYPGRPSDRSFAAESLQLLLADPHVVPFVFTSYDCSAAASDLLGTDATTTTISPMHAHTHHTPTPIVSSSWSGISM